WLTQPLEEVSEPPAELAAVEPVAVEPAAPVIPIAPDPEPELELDLPTAVLPDLLPEAAWPVEPVAEPVAEAALVPEPEPVLAFELAPDPNPGSEPEPEPDVPFYKKQLSLSLKPRAPKAPKQPKEPKAKREKKEKPAREASEKVPFYKRELSFRRAPKEPAAAEAVTEVTPPGEAPAKVPFYKRDLSLKRSAKEWDPGEAVTEETPARPKLRRPPRPRPSLPSISRGGGGGGKQLVGLKIGGSQIAAARIRNGESPELLQAARMPLEHGVVVNGELRDPEALALALKGFFAQHKLPKRGVRLGIANNRIGVRTFEVTGIDDQKQLANAIRFRAQEVLPIPLEEAVLDYQVLSEGTTEDGQPVRRVLLVVAYRELVDRYDYACR
ncbi:MAG: pilus assembly protein PilM, partial [Thermoleophilia bacterium]|nr:pilus assembly protein PilM [Thermoleophilia bacterium]